MCDEHTEADNAAFLKGALSRRAFGAATAAAGAMIVLPRAANAMAVKGRDVTIKTAAGTCDAYFVAPASGKHPAVLVWPDIFGLRPAFRQMADRLAESGYAVLTVNPFYRSLTAPALAASGDRDAIFGKAAEARKLLTPEAVIVDATSFIAFIDKQPEVDRKRGIGTTGYCMGGPLVMQTCAAVPGRVRAGGTFHGGGLAADPFLALVPKMQASFLIAVAQNDDAKAPGDKDKVRAALAAANRPAEIEVYPAQHGWCPPDSPVYDQAQAEKAWGRLLALLGKALA
ncbi:MAG: dienelactone hydrolase family protein [Sphingomonas sp.]|uniref:dienelactone hydrolase family protein n=1 Tax=Sphingomonas sp. TaxID=28214 RepID=UPI0025D92BCD|nr:dienelactone hydrolase family protein [Sphingomonas sp.]MBX3563803.1 dienelactone hydrolase family protein [Sphingomonas sp.]